jgi:hypothetical protein
VPQAKELQINSYTLFGQSGGVIASVGAGHFVVAWQSIQDGYGSGIFAQRFASDRAGDIDGDGGIGALTDGLLLLRYLFGFRGPVLITGVVGPGCTRCTAPAIESYLAAKV